MRFNLPIWSLGVVAAASAVQELNSTNFDEFVARHELSLVSFIAPWCQFCQELEPKYEAAATILHEKGWPLARVDCVDQKALCEEHKIPIYPSIFAFRGTESSVYNGMRTTEAIVSFMNRYSRPIVTSLGSLENVAEFSTKDRVVVVGHMDAHDDQSKKVFYDVAQKHRDKYLFGVTSDDSLQDEVASKPAVVVYKSFDEGKSTYTNAFVAEDVEDFLLDASIPSIEEIGVDRVYAPGGRIAVIFADGLEQRNQLISMLRPVAQKTREKLSWIIVDPKHFPHFPTKVALKPGTWPAFGIADPENDFRFACPHRGSVEALNAITIQRFVEDFAAEKLEPTIRSDPVTEDDGSPIRKLVADNYEEVFDSGRDVFILYFSPTCKHCEKLAPTYMELGELMKPYADQLIVAQIDATTNDVWPRVDIYPTLKYFKSGLSNAPVDYNGNRSIADFVKFIRETATESALKNLDESVAPGGIHFAAHDEL